EEYREGKGVKLQQLMKRCFPSILIGRSPLLDTKDAKDVWPRTCYPRPGVICNLGEFTPCGDLQSGGINVLGKLVIWGNLRLGVINTMGELSPGAISNLGK